MMSLASQMYDYYVKPYLGEKGQDLVEYALLLAIVVGIGFLIYQSSGLNDNLKQIFNNASQVTSSAGYQRTPALAGVLWKGGQS